ncbi:unnamed protein product [Auanema sp. JU1783]|nr:unnamed protein product [Auanema sp. JU1783]
MSIVDDGCGVLDTHVTWDDIQDHLYLAFGRDASMGVDKTINEITEANGFASKMCILEPNFSNESLPKKLIVKILSLASANNAVNKINIDSDTLNTNLVDENEKRAKAFSMYHNHEVLTYNLLNSIEDMNYPIVKVYSSQAISLPENPTKGFIIMEYLENIENIHLDSCFDDRIMSEVLRATAKIHSSTRYMNDENKENLKLGTYKELFRPILRPEFITSSLALTKRFLGEEEEAAIVEAEEICKKMGTQEMRNLFDQTCEVLDMKPVLLHGDLWVTNVALQKNAEGEVNMKAIIDFQGAHIGSLAHDLVRLFCSVLPAEDFEELSVKYLKEYYEYLKEYSSEESLPGSFEQVLESFYRLLPIGAFIIASTMTLIHKLVAERRADPQKTSQIIRDKCIVLIKLIPKYYERYYS